MNWALFAQGCVDSRSLSDQQSLVDNLASLLGTSSSDLVTQLQSGADLSDLLAAKGVSLSSLASTIQGSLYVDATA